ncbi:TadE/TadG family type IV pilus assembly protein [Stenotrophomonas koreensis]|uniref:TadE/TadG family type IV pilus assembly protein n=1 Tax=Stenotrophomonas koreensis TaxID=266128 RepID=UPI00339911AF
MSLHHRPAHRQRGQSMVEFCIVVPLFLFLLLLILQMVLIYRAKSTLDYATFQAARTGAVNGADPDAMRNRLALGLVPLWTHSPDLGGVAAARAKTQGELLLGHATLEVISPTKQMWNQFRERQYDGRLALPNDTLQYRNRAINAQTNVHIQDANVLRIKAQYDFPLIVPFVDRVIVGASRLLSEGPDTRLRRDLISGRYRLPLVSSAEVRMQSPVYEQNNLR